jgi:glycosyltransferase involved in cell wall biosynthesis
MRLWVVTTSYPARPAESTNAGVLARDLALHAAGAGHEVTVATPRKPHGLEVDPGLAALPLPWLFPTTAMSDLSARRPLDLVRAVSLFAGAHRTLLARARHSPPDALVALWALPSGLFARWVARATGAPYAVWLLGSDVWKAPGYPGGVAALRRALAGAVARFADGRELARRARELTGVEVDFLPSARRLPAPARDPLPPADLLFVGRFHPNKGPDLLLEAFALLVEDRPGLTLRLHGAGELAPRLAARARRTDLAGRVRVEGPLAAPELAAALAATRLLVVPSRLESVPLILADAAQAGARVVATDVGDMAEVVAALELGGVAPPGDPRALATALARELDRPRSAARTAARPALPDEIFARLLSTLGPAFAPRPLAGVPA